MKSLWFIILLATVALGSQEGFLKDRVSENLQHSSDEITGLNSSDALPHTDVHAHKPHGVKVASFKFEYVREQLVLTSFIVIIGLFKLAYHHIHWLQSLIPESCCLIVLGAILGFAFVYDNTHESVKFLEFDARTFFFFLLPPIILESAYSLKDRAFLENLGTIILYAVLGTVMNIMIIGGSLIAISELGWISGFQVDPLDCLVFASLIAAVDPVAVLAIFQEVGVNSMLYFMVFGESLLNDAVTVVCYNLVIEFKELPEITLYDCFLGVIAFLCVAFGGLFIGLLCGVLSAWVTKYTKDVRVVEPVFLFGMAYLSFVLSEMFHFSGIIGIIACGLFQTHYSCSNISSKSFISVTYFAKVASSVAESLIFIILGVMLVNERGWFWSDWHPLFSVYSLLLCIVARVGVVFFLTYIVNQFTGGVRYISFKEQFIMAYGGLRGAVSFSLAFMISDAVPTKSTLLSATYIVILFTVFVQGSTIKPLVRYLDIRLAKKEDNFRLFLEFNKGMIIHMTQGLEDLCGVKDTSWMNFSSSFSKKYVRPLLEKDYNKDAKNPENKLLQIDREETMREQMNKSHSTNSFKSQQQIEQLAEQGEISREMIEEEDRFLVKKEDVERKTDEMIKDNTLIRQLINRNNNFYVDRNLEKETEKETIVKRSAMTVRNIQQRARNMNTGEAGVRRRIFGKNKQNKSMTQGLILASVGTMGVQTIEAEQEDDTGIHMTMATVPSDHQLYTITENEVDARESMDASQEIAEDPPLNTEEEKPKDWKQTSP